MRENLRNRGLLLLDRSNIRPIRERIENGQRRGQSTTAPTRKVLRRKPGPKKGTTPKRLQLVQAEAERPSEPSPDEVAAILGAAEQLVHDVLLSS